MNIISFDTCFGYFSAALMVDDEIIAEFQELEKSKQSEKLILTIENLLKAENLSYSDFQTVAVSSGPGSFTGVKIGLAAAKMMTLASKMQIIPLSTLEILASKFFEQNLFDNEVTCLINAQRNQFYMQKFTRAQNPKDQFKKSDAIIIDHEEFFANNFKLVSILANEHQEKYLPSFSNKHNVKIFDDIHARDICYLAKLKYEHSNFKLEEVEPVYIRPADAEISKKSLL